MPTTQPTLKRGDIGDAVVALQKLLIDKGYSLTADGIFGYHTENCVKTYQLKMGLIADGVVGKQTWSSLHNSNNTFAFDKVVDEYYPLSAQEYVGSISNKIGVCLHHTVSNGNPYKVVDGWEVDSRGTVATHFVIGNHGAHDGVILQCMPLENWAHHILTRRMGFSSGHNTLTNKSYIGIELCSWGCLKREEGVFKTLDGRIEIPDSEVVVLETPFRTFQYWHKYSDKQIESLYNLLAALKEHLNLDYPKDVLQGHVTPENYFELSWSALAFQRILTTHTNFEYGKFDCYPQKELVEVFDKLYEAV